VTDIATLPVRTVHEWTLESSHTYAEPFTDVTVRLRLTAPSGATHETEAFHDLGNTWRVRFNPGEVGTWSWTSASVPPNPDFAQKGRFETAPNDARGFLRSTPGEGWGFAFESGEPIFILGDTVYHLFGYAHDHPGGVEAVRRFMTRRRNQGFNLLRVRIPVSPFHLPDGYNTWQTGNLWPWQGSPQMPRFDRFNVDYFRTIDGVIRHADEIGIGIEMIMQGWGNEFPFNARAVFLPEWEELWIRYLVARYDAFNAVWMWQLANEYEYYPNGDWNYSPGGIADRWAMRVGHLVRRLGPHRHVIAVHNGPRRPSFGKRFASDPEVIDTVMYQAWGTTSEDSAWLAAGIEGEIEASLHDWPGSAVFAEWGYEFNPDLPPMMLAHRWCDADHTRRGAWRGAMCRMGVVHGFHNTWGPFMELEEDQPGLASLLHLHRFFTETVPFADMRPAHGIAKGHDERPGRRPLALANADRSILVVYLPAGGTVRLETLPDGAAAQWFDPRTGRLSTTTPDAPGEFTAPSIGNPARPDDWVLLAQVPG
jgi:hypothetical protein